MKMTLTKKILLGFISCAIVLLAVAVFSFKNSEQFIATNQWVNHTHQVLYEFEQVIVNVVDAETGERGYLITGDENYLEPFNNSKTRWFEHIDSIRGLTADNPTQQENIKLIDGQSRSLLNLMNKCIDVRKTKGLEEATAYIKTGTGKRMMDSLRVMITGAKDVEQQLLVKRQQTSENDARNFNLVFIMLLLVIVLVLVVVYFIINTNLKALKRAEDETARKNWTLAGSSELVKGMQGNKSVTELAQTVINHLARYLNIPIGIFYIAEEDQQHLNASAAYAGNKINEKLNTIRFGEGLAGQSAIDNKSILFTEIPSGHLNLHTGFGEVRPKSILATPCSYEGVVTGVIELGSPHDFTEIQKEYLQTVLDSIAIAIVSAQSREKTKELLEETQRQAEELEVQQEELKQSNEELHIKTELLERSESELKAQQEELQQTNEELEEKANLLEEQKGKLENAKTEIEKKAAEVEITSKYKSEFLANMSHELRTPLNSILILSQLLAENKNNVLGKKEIEFSKNIYNSGTDLLNLINEILDLSKVEAGKMQLDIVEFPVQNMIGNISSLFSEVAKSKSIDFKINYNESELSTITTDRQRVEQIVRNFLSNAFKFTEKGGTVTLAIRRASADAGFKTKRNNTLENAVAISVSDSGIGIPKEKREIIFEAFQQADGSTKRKYGGTGLGLSISRELAHALGGEIGVESEEGKGSTFTLYLPETFDPSFIVSADKEIEVAEKKSPETKLPAMPVIEGESPDDRNNIDENDRVILIIEDDEKFAEILLDFVRTRNYKGIIANQGSAGISYARHYKPDAILLDINLPVLGGIQVLKQVKNDPDLRHIPVQIISGYDHRKEGLELGAFDYITKPVSINTLQQSFEKIENFISRKLKKLLIIEDNELQNKAIRELIGNGDVKCYSAYSGAEAYGMMEKEPFDCLIVDLGLPDMSGFTLLEKIKATDQMNKIPVIVYTGRDLSKEENNRLVKLADTVVLKTVDSQERLLDETVLFLHRMESKLPKEKQNIIRKLHKTDEILFNKKIMLVDDDIRNIYSLSNVLEEEGIQCLVAENGKEAIAMLEKHPDVDLVLMDIMMPEMDGYEATVEIRKIERFRKLPVIALTAKAMKGDKEKCLAVGMSDYISKPVEIEQLLSLLRVWLYK
ncbi:MAG: signal transduction histidine kinase [Bacteroidetes bacterium]|nr:signal transduction histidine kinase [Bacteroidota bacterium]